MLGGKGFCCALLLLISTGALAQSADDIKDGKVCANCHADTPLIWGGKHGTKADSRTPIAIVGCATCHGDPSEHLKSGSPMPRSQPAAARIGKIKAMPHNTVDAWMVRRTRLSLLRLDDRVGATAVVGSGERGEVGVAMT